MSVTILEIKQLVWPHSKSTWPYNICIGISALLFQFLTSLTTIWSLYNVRLAMATNVEPHKTWLSCSVNDENADRENNKATCWHVRTMSCHKTEQKKKTNPKKPDGTRLTFSHRSQLASHKKIWNKRKTIERLFQLQYMAPCARSKPCICLGLVAQKQGRGGKQWPNVFVAEPQKLIAAYLHSRDHTQRSLLNGETSIVIKDIVIKGSGSVLGEREIL